MMHEYRNNGNYLEREKLNQFIDKELKYVIRKDDSEMDQNEKETFTISMINILSNLNKLHDNHCNNLNETFEMSIGSI